MLVLDLLLVAVVVIIESSPEEARPLVAVLFQGQRVEGVRLAVLSRRKSQ
jgi:predicted molibdopterin-dependent oxidoreductase YjgC